MFKKILGAIALACIFTVVGCQTVAPTKKCGCAATSKCKGACSTCKCDE